MWGCCSWAARWISRWKRSRLTPGRQVGRQDLDHDLAGEGALRGDEHAAHPAALELALDGVGAADRRFQLVPEGSLILDSKVSSALFVVTLRDEIGMTWPGKPEDDHS